MLRSHDRYGYRIDQVDYDPAYHQLMAHATALGLHGTAWADRAPHPHLIRAAKLMVWGHVDGGHLCPIGMGYAVVPTLRRQPDLAALLEPKVAARGYDPVLAPLAGKQYLLPCMSMTEKQGGSDLRANTTRAVPDADGGYRITGHKWFTSAPIGDFLLVLAQAPGGLTCFLAPRILPDGERNGILLQRLKDKLGNRSNASSEVEYDNAFAWRVGEEGRGVPTIIEMVNMTRLDCVLFTTILMQAGVQRAAHHATHRAAFGSDLIDQPLMRNVLADLAVEAEAATTVGLWLAALNDRAVTGDEHANALRRISLAVTKYYVCKRGPVHTAESLECLGGNGYVEESGMPRMYREAPLMSVWEGSGNVAALDLLRAIARQPETLSAFFAELADAAGADRRLDRAVHRLKDRFVDSETLRYRGRELVGAMAKALQASLLIRFGHPAVADAYAATRLDTDGWGDVFGTLPTGLDIAPIVDRATPKNPSHATRTATRGG